MKVVNNSDISNCHFNTIIELIRKAEEVLIVSPFISSNSNLIPQEHFKNIKHFTFVTTLPELYTEQEKKVNFFLYLLSISVKYSFSLNILIDDSLHGKVYIGKTGNNYETIVTSANFTKNGLKTNNEWGVYFTDNNVAQNIWQSIVSNSKVRELTSTEIHQYAQIINSQKITSSKNPVLSYKLSLPVLPLISNSSKNFTCWLKPLGTKENPISDSELHDTLFRDITFAVRPTGIREGDIIICYAAHRKYIVCVYKAASIWFPNNYNKSFPYSVRGENLFPYYGAEWSKLNITIDAIKSKVISKQQFTITPNGTNNYLRLTRADKMRVTPEYTQLVMQEIEVENNRIASLMMTD